MRCAVLVLAHEHPDSPHPAVSLPGSPRIRNVPNIIRIKHHLHVVSRHEASMPARHIQGVKPGELRIP